MNKIQIIALIDDQQTTIPGTGRQEKRKMKRLATLETEDERMGVAVLAAISATCPNNYRVGMWQNDDNGVLTELTVRTGNDRSSIGGGNAPPRPQAAVPPPPAPDEE